MRVIKEAYLDKEEKFWDYGTGEVSGSDIFDTRKTGMSYYDNFIHDPEYMKNSKNLESKIVMMTPTEYFQGCADVFESDKQTQINQTAADKNTIEKLKYVIQHYKRKFPVTFLNYASKQQEGRHRMYVAGELFGWNTKHPVMIIDYADKEKAAEKKRQEEKRELDSKVRIGTKDALEYRYRNIDEFKDQLQWSLNRAFGKYFGEDEDVEFNLAEEDDVLTVSAKGGSYEFSKDDIRIEDAPEEDTLDDEELDQWLMDYIDDFDLKSDEEKDRLRDKIRNA